MNEALITKANSAGTQLYDQLCNELQRLIRSCQSQSEPQYDQLVALLKAISFSASLVHDRRHERLLREVLELGVWAAPSDVLISYLELITHLVVACSGAIQACLHALCYALLPPPGFETRCQVAVDNPGDPWAPTEEAAATQDLVIETLIRTLVLIPTAGTRALPLLIAVAPHRLRGRSSHCFWLRAVTSLAESGPGGALKDSLLLAVIDHLITIDVEIMWEDIVDVKTTEAFEETTGLDPREDDEPDIFELEGMNEQELALLDDSKMATNPAISTMRGGWEGGLVPASEAVDAPAPSVNEMADKLDSLMELCLKHLMKRMMAAGQLQATWETLVGAFEKTILHTHRSKFTQYVVFFAAQKAPESCCKSFISLLLTKLTDKGQPSVTRSACAAYVASFLARAAFTPEPVVIESLQKLVEWLMKYIRDEDRRGGLPPIPSNANLLGGVNGCSESSSVLHAAFYAGCQSLLYVLCYHLEPVLRKGGKSLGSAVAEEQSLCIGVGNTAAAKEAAPLLPHTTVWPTSSSPSNIVTGKSPALTGTSPSYSKSEAKVAARVAGAESLIHICTELLPKLLTHELDPLSSIAQSVVIEFGRQAKTLGFTDLSHCYKSWESKQRSSGIYNKHRPLEVFFPYDPYLLARSASLLELDSTYVCWQRGHPSGAARAGLSSSSSSDDDMSSLLEEDMITSEGGEEEEEDGMLSLSSDDGSSDSSSGSDDDETLKRTRFGSMHNSSMGSYGRHAKRRLPGALKASLAAHSLGGASPTLGFPGGGSCSTDGGLSSPLGGPSPRMSGHISLFPSVRHQ